MNDLTTLPSSVRFHLERAQNLSNQDRGNEALSALRQAAITLATTNPDLCGALLAAHLGFNELTLRQTDEWKEVTRTAKRVMGVQYGEDIQTVTKRHTTTRQIGFSNGPKSRY